MESHQKKEFSCIWCVSNCHSVFSRCPLILKQRTGVWVWQQSMGRWCTRGRAPTDVAIWLTWESEFFPGVSWVNEDNTYIIKYRKQSKSRKMNNPLVYIDSTNQLLMDGAASWHQGEGICSYSIPNSTNQNQRSPTYKKEGSFCPSLFLCQGPKMQQKHKVHGMSRLVTFTDLFYWACLMCSS